MGHRYILKKLEDISPFEGTIDSIFFGHLMTSAPLPVISGKQGWMLQV